MLNKKLPEEFQHDFTYKNAWFCFSYDEDHKINWFEIYNIPDRNGDGHYKMKKICRALDESKYLKNGFGDFGVSWMDWPTNPPEIELLNIFFEFGFVKKFSTDDVKFDFLKKLRKIKEFKKHVDCLLYQWYGIDLNDE